METFRRTSTPSAILVALALAAAAGPVAQGQDLAAPIGTGPGAVQDVRLPQRAPRPSAPSGGGSAYAGVAIRVLWWDCTPEYGGQAPDALRQAMSDHLDNYAGGGVFDSTYVSSEIAGTFAPHMASNNYDVIVFDCTTSSGPLNADDQAALTTFYDTHRNVLLDGNLYVRSAVANATSIFPGINGCTGDYTVNEVWQLADRGGGVMIGTDHDCCHGMPNYLLDAMIPDAEFSGSTSPSVDGQFNGVDLLEAIANVSVFDLFAHWDSLPSQGVAPTGMFTNVFGDPVELFSQVDVADDPGGGPQFSYVSTTWEPSGDGPEFDCNDNGILDSTDILNQTSEDKNLNTIPDECEEISTAYCTPGVVNSTGGPAGIMVLGSTAAADRDLTLTAFGLPVGELCLFVTSQNQGLIVNPGNHTGNLCVVRPGFARFARHVVTSDASGLGSMTLTPWRIPTSPSQSILAGQTWNFQAWYRDGSDCNLTDAASVDFQ
jgi:hypothetical protein